MWTVLENALTASNLLFMVVGMIIGIVCGALPGLSATMAVALVLPATFALDPRLGLSMLVAVYVGATFGGSISAILLNIPGTPASMMTAADGNPLARKGMAGKALGVAISSSFFGGIFSGAVLILFAPILGRWALSFGPAEFFAIGVFALCLIASMLTDDLIKGFIAGIIGVFVGCIGTDPLSGATRFTFGSIQMSGGLELVPLLVGYFGFREVLNQISECSVKVEVYEQISKLIPSRNDFKRIWPTSVRSSIIGTFIGILPGAGGPIASFLAYDTEQKINGKRFTSFGKGEICGIAASEAANNAVCGGALIPLLTLGVPGDGVTAVLLGAFRMQNINPGPSLFTKEPVLVNTLYTNYILACVLMVIVGLIGAKFFMQVIKLPQSILMPLVLMICIVGSFSVRNNLFDVGVMMAAGTAAFVLEKRNFPVIAIVLGTILSYMIELRFRNAMQLDQSGAIFFKNPICIALLGASALLVISAVIRQTRKYTRSLSAK